MCLARNLPCYDRSVRLYGAMCGGGEWLVGAGQWSPLMLPGLIRSWSGSRAPANPGQESRKQSWFFFQLCVSEGMGHGTHTGSAVKCFISKLNTNWQHTVRVLLKKPSLTCLFWTLEWQRMVAQPKNTKWKDKTPDQVWLGRCFCVLVWKMKWLSIDCMG